MNPLEFLRDILAQFSAAPPWALLLTKATLLLAVAWVVHFSLARANPRWRTLLWRGAAVGLVLMAVWIPCLPGLAIRVPAPEPVATQPAAFQSAAIEPVVTELVSGPSVCRRASADRPSACSQRAERSSCCRRDEDNRSARPGRGSPRSGRTGRAVRPDRCSWPLALLGVWGSRCGVAGGPAGDRLRPA